MNTFLECLLSFLYFSGSNYLCSLAYTNYDYPTYNKVESKPQALKLN